MTVEYRSERSEGGYAAKALARRVSDRTLPKASRQNEVSPQGLGVPVMSMSRVGDSTFGRAARYVNKASRNVALMRALRDGAPTSAAMLSSTSRC